MTRVNSIAQRILHCLTLLFALTAMVACSEHDDTWNPYYDWKTRNAQWFQQVADSARTAIQQAKELHGDDWQAHCSWRMYKSLLKNSTQGPLTDSICVKIVQRGDGDFSPAYTDSVRLNFRGWTMKTEYTTDNGTLEPSMAVFTQTYYGPFNPATAAPQTMSVGGTVEGFSTALQYMVTGDDWYVYMPHNLAYGEKANADIPAYSTLLFRINMVGAYESGSGMPGWK